MDQESFFRLVENCCRSKPEISIETGPRSPDWTSVGVNLTSAAFLGSVCCWPDINTAELHAIDITTGKDIILETIYFSSIEELSKSLERLIVHNMP